jgi:hypothetical protein
MHTQKKKKQAELLFPIFFLIMSMKPQDLNPLPENMMRIEIFNTSLSDCFYTVTLSVFVIGRICSNWAELSPNCRFCHRSSGRITLASSFVS